MGRGSKRRNQTHHTSMRALQRFGVSLNRNDLEKMAEEYRHGRSSLVLDKQSNRRVLAVITYKDTCFPVIYDKERHQLATVLGPDHLSAKHRSIYDGYVRKLTKGGLEEWVMNQKRVVTPTGCTSVM